MKKAKQALCLAVCLLIVGCVSNPSKISFRDAMYQVGEGLVYSQVGRDEALAKVHAKPGDFGLYPSEVVVTFNVAAGSTISAEGSGSASTIPGSPTLKLAGAWTGNRGNTITLKFQSIYYRLPGQVGADLPTSSSTDTKGGTSVGGAPGGKGGGDSSGGTVKTKATVPPSPPPDRRTIMFHNS
jgi:hypothetical protein